MTPDTIEPLNDQLRQTAQLIEQIAAHCPAAIKGLEDLAAAALTASIACEQLAASQSKAAL